MSTTATQLEQYGDAFVAAFSSWMYPSDVECRFAAMSAAALVHEDYIERVAHVYETAVKAAESSGLSRDTIHPDNARFAVAMGFFDAVMTLRSQGHAPREGILATGKPADGLGRDEASYADPDDYGSLA